MYKLLVTHIEKHFHCLEKKVKGEIKNEKEIIKYFIYDIGTKKDNIYVKKNELIECFQAPCNPIEVDNFKVKYKDEYQDFVENLFKNKNTKEITIARSELSENQIKILSSITKDDFKDNNDISYNIIDSDSYKYDENYSQRGYYVKQLKDGKVRVTIAMGEKNTGGYNISILRVNIIDGGAQIYIEENSPSKDSIVTEAFTYPIAQVEFNAMPEYITVQSLDTFLEFEKIK